jgi:hypothetical protein
MLCKDYFSDMNIRIPSMKPYLLAGLALWLTGLQTASAQIEKDTQWRDAVVTKLDVDFGSGFHARWQFHRCDCGDLQVMVEQVAPDDTLTGELLMVDGQALLAKGFEQQGADIEPLIQAPSLMLQLAYAMLNRSEPDGPAAITGKQRFKVHEKRKHLNLDTGLATGSFAAPWSIEGEGWKVDPAHIRFEMELDFTVSPPGEKREAGKIVFSGDLDFNPQDFPYGEDTDLEGWRLQWLSLNERSSVTAEKGTTLKSLREKAEKQ